MTTRWAGVLAAAALLGSCGACGKADGVTGVSPDANALLDSAVDSGPPLDATDAGLDGRPTDTGHAADAAYEDVRIIDDANIVSDTGADQGPDGARDASRDGSSDASADSATDCKEPGDLEGTYLDRDWNAPVNLVEYEYMASIGEKHLAWIVPKAGSNTSGNAIRFLDLKTKNVMQVPNCQGIHMFNELTAKDDLALWTNGYDTPDGQGRRVAFFFDLSKNEPPKVVSADAPGSVFYLHFHADQIVYLFIDGPNQTSFLSDLATGTTKELVPDATFSLLNADMFDRRVINGTSRAIRSLDVDSLEIKVHKPNTDERILVTGYYQRKVAYQSWIDSSKYGHPSTDVFVIDTTDDSVVRLTADERSQWAPAIHGNLVLWQEVADEKAEEGWGYYVIHDLETGARRRIPGLENDGGPWGLTKTHAAISGGASGISNPLYLVDLEKTGVVKDGHVVPEAGDGGIGRD